jgi:hypothetical protein
MSGRVVFVDFAAWGASEARQRAVCGLRGYVLRGAEARAAAASAEDGLPFFPTDSHPLPPAPTDPRERTLPGMAGWLAAQRTGVQHT